MEIEYIDHLPEKYRQQATRLYLASLHEKLMPVFNSQEKALEILASSMNPNSCHVAVAEGQLVGILGIQTHYSGFINPDTSTMIEAYGVCGGFYRIAILTLLHHATGEHEIYIDGIAVCPEKRGQGIGSRLLHLLQEEAAEQGMERLSLEVISSNAGAKALYHRLGFVEVKTESFWPLNVLVKFPFHSTTLMTKEIGGQRR